MYGIKHIALNSDYINFNWLTGLIFFEKIILFICFTITKGESVLKEYMNV